jgi:hypothetical protein
MTIIKTLILISLTVLFLVPETSGQAVNVEKLKPIVNRPRIQTGIRSLQLLMARYGFAEVIIGEPMRQSETSISPTGMKGHGDLGTLLYVLMILQRIRLLRSLSLTGQVQSTPMLKRRDMERYMAI